MQNIYSILFLFFISITLTQDCHSVSTLEDKTYQENFPAFENFSQQEIENAILEVDKAIVRKDVKPKDILLVPLENKQGEVVQMLVTYYFYKYINEDDITEDLFTYRKMEGSPYVLKFFGCFQKNIKYTFAQGYAYYVFQEDFNFVLKQDKEIIQTSYGKYKKVIQQKIPNPDYIKNAMPNFTDRLVFYIKLLMGIDWFQSRKIVHNDINPETIAVPLNGYSGNPRYIQFEKANRSEDKPICNNSCYEFKNKRNMTINDTRTDVYSVGVVILEMESSFMEFCFLYNTKPYNKTDAKLKEKEKIEYFNELIMGILKVESMDPGKETVTECQTFECVMLFILNNDLQKIPVGYDAALGLRNVYQLQHQQQKNKKII